jgi:hypothetical protein
MHREVGQNCRCHPMCPISLNKPRCLSHCEELSLQVNPRVFVGDMRGYSYS